MYPSYVSKTYTGTSRRRPLKRSQLTSESPKYPITINQLQEVQTGYQ